MKHIQIRVLNRLPLLKEILVSLVIWLLIGAAAVAVFYYTMSALGFFERLEMALDLKADSPFIVFPLIIFAGIAILSFAVGSMMYFHKYKRGKTLSPFSQAFSAVMTEAKKSQE